MPALADYLTTRDVANLLDVSTGWVRQLCIRGELEADKLGRSWVVTPEALERYQVQRNFNQSNN